MQSPTHNGALQDRNADIEAAARGELQAIRQIYQNNCAPYFRESSCIPITEVFELPQVSKFSKALRGKTAQQLVNLLHFAPLSRQLDVDLLAAAMQAGVGVDHLRFYITKYKQQYGQLLAGPALTTAVLDGPWRLISYALASGQIAYVKLCMENGYNPKHNDNNLGRIPDLLWCIIYGSIRRFSYAQMTGLLAETTTRGMSMGFLPREILQNPEISLFDPKYDAEYHSIGMWSESPKLRSLMSSALDADARYELMRCSWHGAATKTTLDVANAMSFECIHQIPHSIIGQRAALQAVYDTMLIRLCRPKPTRRSLVIAMNGPTGHGKSLLAGHLVDLLQHGRAHSINCSTFGSTTEAFFGKLCADKMQDSRTLSDYLLRHDGRAGVVILDNLDRAKPEVINSLVSIIDKGRYVHEGYHKLTNVSSITWIIITYIACDEVQSLWQTSSGPTVGVDSIRNFAWKANELLKSAYARSLSTPLAKCVKIFVPFVSFGQQDREVLARIYLREQQEAVLEDIVLQPENQRFVGHINLRYRDIAVLVKQITLQAEPAPGARGLKLTVNRMVGATFLAAWREADLGIISEALNDGPLLEFVVDVVDRPDEAAVIAIKYVSQPGHSGAQ